ncbi:MULTISPECIES: UvrD-helicase domain-containing protein [Bacillaceae]|uniref:DNA 3'-5' helicase n=1 Tax=Evansella alkalicola TaxID=745819 RepID=A0ABS6JZ50_9BACI|nr:MULTISPECIES: UvrD-helicase domain-containing protein [Bacillaceae]MBU9723859.1 UvrD-helicase domain-containing protein [Bacillus alkalicola]
MTKFIPRDQPHRDQIGGNLEDNILVEAGAGSGKTTSLVERMVNTVLAGKVRANQIAAITFTRKAANELKERFQIALEEKYVNSVNSREQELINDALTDLDQTFLGTIHSFCAKLLKERPIEGNVDPDFQELDDLEDKLVQNAAWEEYLNDLQLTQKQVLDDLHRIGITALDLKASYGTLIHYPDVDWVTVQTERPDFRPAFSKLKVILSEAIRAVPNEEPPNGYDPLQKIIRQANRRLRFIDSNDDLQIKDVLKPFESPKKATQYKWNTKEDGKHFTEVFQDFAEGMVQPLLQQWREHCHYYIIQFLKGAAAAYEKRKLQQSMLNFQDLLMKTSDMLRKYPEVRSYFQEKYRVLMVDEFQDTDPIQAEIVFYLTGENVEEKNWRKLIPRQGSLFVVGDPKQSIYRFRRADIDTYNLVKELIEEHDGKVLELTANFRSLHSIKDTVNPVFQPLMPEERNSYQAQFRPLDTVREDEAPHTSGLKILEIPEEFKKKDEVVKEEAERIAKYIAWAVNGNVTLARTPKELKQGVSPKAEAKDFMILIRYKDSMDVYARMLEDYGIPVEMSGSTSLQDSREIQELFKLIKLLAQPDHQVYLTAVLKGLFFGLSDNDLFQYKQAGGVFQLFATVPESLSLVQEEGGGAASFRTGGAGFGTEDTGFPAETEEEGGAAGFRVETEEETAGFRTETSEEEAGFHGESGVSTTSFHTEISSALSRLQKYYYWTRKYTPVVALEKIIEDLGLVAFAASSEMPKSETGYVYQMLEMIRKKESSGASDFATIVDQYETILEADVDEELSIREEKNAVRIMNLHKAKGLEAPVVFLAHSMKKVDAGKKVARHIKREEDSSQGFFTFIKPVNEFTNEIIAQPVNWGEYATEEAAYLDAEEVRLVYVAATRAKNMLVVSSSGKNNKNPWNILVQHGQAAKAGVDGGASPLHLEIPDVEEAEQGRKGERNQGDALLEGPSQAEMQAQLEVERKLNVEELIALRENEGEWTLGLKKKSYHQLTPTEQVDKGKLSSIVRKEGGGLQWGSMLHELIEALVKEEVDRKTCVELLLQDYPEFEKRRGEIDRVLDRFERSELWGRICQAEEKYPEVPFSVKIEPGHTLYPAEREESGRVGDRKIASDGGSIGGETTDWASGIASAVSSNNASSSAANVDGSVATAGVPILYSGVIDLVMKEKDGWTIVDYKSDRVKEKGDLRLLAETYGEQIKSYVHIWNELTGEPVHKAEIYFIEEDKCFEVK